MFRWISDVPPAIVAPCDAEEPVPPRRPLRVDRPGGAERVPGQAGDILLQLRGDELQYRRPRVMPGRRDVRDR